MEDSGAGIEMTWDHEPCPLDGCEGELQQQDDYNVMCLDCEAVFVHVTDDSMHYLVDQNHTTAAEKNKLVTDGGQEDSGVRRELPVDCPLCGEPIEDTGDAIVHLVAYPEVLK